RLCGSARALARQRAQPARGPVRLHGARRRGRAGPLRPLRGADPPPGRRWHPRPVHLDVALRRRGGARVPHAPALRPPGRLSRRALPAPPALGGDARGHADRVGAARGDAAPRRVARPALPGPGRALTAVGHCRGMRVVLALVVGLLVSWCPLPARALPHLPPAERARLESGEVVLLDRLPPGGGGAAGEGGTAVSV